jgi:hypothetical protein
VNSTRYVTLNFAVLLNHCFLASSEYNGTGLCRHDLLYLTSGEENLPFCGLVVGTDFDKELQGGLVQPVGHVVICGHQHLGIKVQSVFLD